MGKDDLIEALRFGSEREYTGNDNLGKFGLGLKTASISQCRKLTVASKQFSDERINSFCWDIDHVIRKNSWEVIEPDKSTILFHIDKKIVGKSGTIVIWQNLDRVINLSENVDLSNKNRIVSLCREAETYIGLVFHRFIEGKVGERKLTIYLNGNEIEPWDPFCIEEENTHCLPKQPIPIDHEGIQKFIHLSPYVLPTKETFSSLDAWRKAAGINDWNSQQGFYIYRANRLIQNGGWNHLRTKDEHTKYARIALDFTTDLDEEFKINISKMQVILPKQIRGLLAAAIIPVINKAKDVYRGNRPSKPALPPIAPPSSIKINNPPAISNPEEPNLPKHRIYGSIEPINPNQLNVHSCISSSKPEYMPQITANVQGDGKLWELDELEQVLHSVALCSEENRIISTLFNRLRSRKGN